MADYAVIVAWEKLQKMQFQKVKLNVIQSLLLYSSDNTIVECIIQDITNVTNKELIIKICAKK